MGRPPSSGGPAFRFTHAEVAEMEERLRHLNYAIPHRDVIQGLADKFTASSARCGKIPVQPKQVWNWFQNRRYSQRSRTTRGSPLPQGKMLPTGAEEHHPASFRAQPSSSGHSGSHPAMKNASNVPIGSSREVVQAEMKKMSFWERTLLCMNIDIRKAQHDEYVALRQMQKKQDEIIKAITKDNGDQEVSQSTQSSSEGTLSYGAWSKGLVTWTDFEEISSTSRGKQPIQDDDPEDTESEGDDDDESASEDEY